MLKIIVSGTEMFDDRAQEFTTEGDVVLELEHSLVSLSKWESEFGKAFLGREAKTPEEVVAYVRCMCVGDNFPPEVFHRLSRANFEEINAYIDARMTATWFSDSPEPKTREVITAELIYYWMTAFQIPFECERWHLNRLFTLIRVCNIKQQPPKKMSSTEISQRNAALNAERRQRLNSTG